MVPYLILEINLFCCVHVKAFEKRMRKLLFDKVSEIHIKIYIFIK